MGHEHVIPEFAERMMERIRTGNPEFKIQGTGRETRSFCYIDDCVDGLMVLTARSGERQVYHLGNPAEEHAICRRGFADRFVFRRGDRHRSGRAAEGFAYEAGSGYREDARRWGSSRSGGLGKGWPQRSRGTRPIAPL